MRTIQTTYKYKLKPTKAQEEILLQFAGARRFVWNWALARKIEAYKLHAVSLSFHDLSAELTQLKRQPETSWLRLMHAQSLQQALRDLDKAYASFFRRAKSKRGKAGFPRFKSKKREIPSFRMPQDVSLNNGKVSVPKLGMVRAIVHRELVGETKSATFKREIDGWYVVFVVEQQAPERTGREPESGIGVDLGLKTFATLSTGKEFQNPRWFRVQERKLAKAQRKLSHCQKGSKNRAKARKRVAIIHHRIANQRKDFIHNVTRWMVDGSDLIAIEDLSVAGLAKSKLSKSIHDASFGMFRQFLTYKADIADKYVVVVGRFFPSSKLCGECGLVNDNLTLSMRSWTCEGCGTHHDRDRNAARNILKQGLKLFVEAGSA